METDKIIFLGTSSAFGSDGRNLSSHLLINDGSFLLLDAGPAVITLLKKQGVKPQNISEIYVSHLHGDHFLGLVFFVLEFMDLEPPKAPVSLFLPKDGEKHLEKLLSLTFPSILSKPWQAYFEISEETEGEMGKYYFNTFPADHQENARLLYLESEDYSLGYTGDTGPETPYLQDVLFSSDYLITECTTFEKVIPHHLTYKYLERQKKLIKSKQVFLVHTHEDMVENKQYISPPFKLVFDGEQIALL